VRACVYVLQVGQRDGAYGTCASGGTVERRVMQHDGHAVAGHLHVKLDVASAYFDGVAERGHGILRGLERPAAVGDQDGCLGLHIDLLFQVDVRRCCPT
jgi:hypothetical protein